jgi:beta-mannosidase
MMRSSIVIQVLLQAAVAAAAYHVLDLSEQAWTLASPQHEIKVPGKVPSQAHIDLFAAKVIEDP